MLDLIIGMAVAAGVLAGDQAQPPVFRAEVYIVPVEFDLFTKRPFIGSKPYKDLTMADVSVVLDKKVYPPVTFTPDPKKPGRYMLSFSPSPEYRDGESHLIEVTLKVKGFRSPWIQEQTVIFPKPVDPAAPTRQPD